MYSNGYMLISIYPWDYISGGQGQADYNITICIIVRFAILLCYTHTHTHTTKYNSAAELQQRGDQ